MNRNTILLEHYFQHCEYEKSLSPKTLHAYQFDLNQFTSFLQKHDEKYHLESIPKEIIREYLLSIVKRYKGSSAKRKIASLKAFYSFLEHEEIIQVNHFRRLRLRLNKGKCLPKVIGQEKIKGIINAAHTAKANATTGPEVRRLTRDVAILELLFASGMRVSELCTLNLIDLDMVNGSVLVRGKGERERLIPLCSVATLQALREYLDTVPPEDEGGFLFPGRNDNSLSPQTVRHITRRYADAAGVTMRVTPHMFRHTLATLLLENGVDIRNIQHLLGHSSIAVTEIYVHVSKEAQKRVLLERHPRNDW